MLGERKALGDRVPAHLIFKHFRGKRMKACNKYINKAYGGKQTSLFPSEREKIEETWQAALEWLLSQETVKPLLGHREHKYIDSIILRNELEEV